MTTNHTPVPTVEATVLREALSQYRTVGGHETARQSLLACIGDDLTISDLIPDLREGYPGIAHEFEQCKSQRADLLAALEKIAAGCVFYAPSQPIEVVFAYQDIARAALAKAKA